VTINATVAIAFRDRQEVIDVALEEGATVADALEAAGVGRRFPEIDWGAVRLGIWSRPCTALARVREGDRVEVYRPLTADPKQLRRARLKKPRRS
jgi:putative ubiquitin-RnfH superfamily antitoxin RatB of RatAB toxin-antitoxin module